MEKTLLIFDVDGTLVYSNRIDSQCFAATYEALYNKLKGDKRVKIDE